MPGPFTVCRRPGEVRHRRPGVRFLVAGIAVVTSSLYIAACGGGSGSGSSASNKPYEIGLDGDFSGSDAVSGLGLKNGAEAYFNEINKHGGIDGHQVHLQFLDDQAEPNDAEANMLQFITQDNVIAVIGFDGSEEAAAAAPLADKDHVPMIAATVSQSLVSPPLPYVYAAAMQTAEYGKPSVQFASGLLKGKSNVRVATISVAGIPAFQQWQADVNTATSQLGWHTVAQQMGPYPALNESPQFGSVIASKPDALIMAVGVDSWVIAGMKQIESAGQSFPTVSYDAIAWTTLQAMHDPNFYYMSGLSYATAKATPQYYQDAKAAGLNPNGTYIERGYLEALILGSALKACGYPCTGTKLQQELNKADYSTGGVTAANVQFSPQNHEGIGELVPYSWPSAADAAPVVAGDPITVQR